MDVNQIQVIGLEALQSAFDDALRLVRLARFDFRGEKDIFAPVLHDLADPGFAEPVAVAVGGIHVADAQIEGAIERLQGLIFVLVHEEPATASHGQDGDAGTGPAQNAGRHLAASREGGRAGEGSRAEKATPGYLHRASVTQANAIRHARHEVSTPAWLRTPG